MFTCDDRKARLKELLDIESNCSTRSAVNIAEILKMIPLDFRLDTENITSVEYWNLLYSILNNMDTGTWGVYPSVWLDTIKLQGLTKLTNSEVREYYDRYQNTLNVILTKHSSSIDSYKGFKKLKLHWVNGKNGINNVLLVATALLEISDIE